MYMLYSLNVYMYVQCTVCVCMKGVTVEKEGRRSGVCVCKKRGSHVIYPHIHTHTYIHTHTHTHTHTRQTHLHLY